MEKVFNTHERRGTVRAYQIGSMLKSMNPELAFDPEELKNQISSVDPEGTYIHLYINLLLCVNRNICTFN